MRIQLGVGLFLYFLLLCSACCQKEETHQEYSKKDSFYYRLLSLGGDKKTGNIPFLHIQAVCKTTSDSVFWNSQHHAGGLFFVAKKSAFFLQDLYRFSVGDSLEYLFPTKEFFRQVFQSEIPFFCQKDTAVKFSVKIMNAFSAKEMALFNDSIKNTGAQKAKKEVVLIQQYISSHCKQVHEFAPNAFIEMITSTASDSIKKGKKVKIRYKGFFLDGTVVDYTTKNTPFELLYGQEGQLVSGLQMALGRLKKGEKAKIILPSHLAFGATGSSNGMIPPYMPMVYEIEIIDIN
ncbi:MAG: FKBP-type peptidyl-prolyl cis-trans isomerase [Bacteroidetes bacterium]|nr:FKBP-type peptidyl-prolyl cis-trans isomerase [Bacteroidota bacterium]